MLSDWETRGKSIGETFVGSNQFCLSLDSQGGI